MRHRPYDGGEIGVALLSRFAIRDVERISARTGLAMLAASVDAPRGSVDVLVVHTHPTHPLDAAARRAKMDRLRIREVERAARWAARRDRAIVFGDFNALPSGPEHAVMSKRLRDVCRSGPATWPAELPLVRIDYVWAGPGLTPLRCDVRASEASDHRPVVVELAGR